MRVARTLARLRGKKEKWADDVGRRAHEVEGGGPEGEGERLSSLDKLEALPPFDHVFHFALLLGNNVTILGKMQFSFVVIVCIMMARSIKQPQLPIPFQERASSPLSPSYNAAERFRISSMHRLEE